MGTAKRPRTSVSEYVTTDPRLRKNQPSSSTTDPRKRPPLDIQTSPTIKKPRPQQTALPPQSDPTLDPRPTHHPRTDSSGMSTSAGPGRPSKWSCLFDSSQIMNCPHSSSKRIINAFITCLISGARLLLFFPALMNNMYIIARLSPRPYVLTPHLSRNVN